MAKRLGGVEQFVEIEHPDQASPPERSVVDCVGACERTCMGARGHRSLGVPARFDHDDGLCARRRARSRHELARVVNCLDIKQDRARAGIDGEVVEQVAEIDVDLISERDDTRKAKRAAGCPFHQARSDGARLGDQRKIAGRRHMRGEARIEFGARHLDAETVGTEKTHAARARRLIGAVGERTFSLAESGRHDDGGGATARPGGGNRGGDAFRRRRDHQQVRCRQVGDILDRRKAIDLGVTRIDEMDRPAEACRLQVAQNLATNRVFAGARANDRNGARRKQPIEAIGCHGVVDTRRAVLPWRLCGSGAAEGRLAIAMLCHCAGLFRASPPPWSQQRVGSRQPSLFGGALRRRRSRRSDSDRGRAVDGLEAL